MIEIKRRKQQAAQIPAERAQKPADGLEGQATGEYTPSAEHALKREIRPFSGIDEKRDYRAMYRAAFEYHDRHNPPRIDREYWQTHTPGVDDTPQAEIDYWDKAAQDICEVANRFSNDKFMTGLLCAIYDELGREYADARQQAHNNSLSADERQNGARAL